MFVIGIDIGITHLGFVSTIIKNLEINEIEILKCIDITFFEHRKVKLKDCELYHTKTHVDWINHFFQEYQFYLEKATVILIERQPLCGIVSIEQLIYNKYREKSVLIHPCKLHKFFLINYLSYEERKEKIVQLAKEWIPKRFENFYGDSRKHDMADAILFIIYYLSLLKKEKEKEKEKEKFRNIGLDFDFERFRYKGLK